MNSEEQPQLNRADLPGDIRFAHSNVKRMWLTLTLGIALIYLAFLPPGIYSLDGNGMLAVAESLVDHHSWTVPEELGLPGRGGQFFGKWYPLQSVLAVPMVALATPAADALHLRVHYLAAIFALILPVLFSAMTAGLVGLIALRLGSSAPGAHGCALSYAFGTISLAYARTFYAEPLLALLTAAAIYYALCLAPRQIAYAALCSMLAVLAKPTGVLVGMTIAAYLVATTRSLKRGWMPSLGSLAGLCMYCAYNEMRFGHVFMFGQPWSFRLEAIPEGMAGLLLSPGRGLIWYCPTMLLAGVAFWKAKKSNWLNALLPVAIFAGYLLLHSLWTFWSGGWSWGPRFLLPAIPGLAALLGLLEKNWRRWLMALSVAGFLINAPTLLSFYERYYAEQNEQGVSERDALWSPGQAPLLHAWPAAVRQIQDARKADVRELMAERGATPASNVSTSRALRIVAVWWWVLPLAHVPRMFGVAIAILLVVAGSLILRDPVRPPGSSKSKNEERR